MLYNRINKYYYWALFLGLPVFVFCFQSFYNEGQVSLLFYVSTVLLSTLEVIGGMVGLGIGLWADRKTQRTNDELIQESDQLKKDLSDK